MTSIINSLGLALNPLSSTSLHLHPFSTSQTLSHPVPIPITNQLLRHRHRYSPLFSNNSSYPPSSHIVTNFYDAINRRDLGSVQHLIALNCVYEDLVFPQPFIGRQAILNFFNQFTGSISPDLQFVIDDISDEEDTLTVGVTWHLEWKGKPFPFSRGCSFYRLQIIDAHKQIVYGRDCVEPAIKPGDAALVVIRGVTWLLEKFPFLANRL